MRTLSPNPICVINRRNGCGTTLLKKGLTEKLSNKVVGVINRRNGCGTTLLKKGLTEKLSNKVVGVINRRNGCGTTLLKKGLTENPWQRLSLRALSPNLFRRDQPAQRLRVNGCFKVLLQRNV